jgi:hypothetical protein
MGKRVVAIVVGVLAALALGVGGVMVASRSGEPAPAMLPALQVAGDQADAQSAQAAVAGGAGSPDGRAESRITQSGRVQYRVRGTLPDLPRSARAWTLPDRVTKARVAELAGKLGLTGEPRRSGQTWTVADGTRRLLVNPLPGGPWTYSAGRFVCGGPVGGIGPKGGISSRLAGCPAVGGIPPVQQSPAATGSASASGGQGGAATPAVPTPPSGGQPGAPPPPSTRPQPPLPDRATAERLARDLLTRVAAPMTGAEVRVVQGFDRWSVSAFPRVGGRPTAGFVWTAGIGAKGEILSATGWLDSPRPGDTYPLISVREALQRLRNRQVPGPITEAPGSLPCARTEQPQLDGCGPAKPLTLQVTDVRLGLQFATALAGTSGAERPASYLVPAYFFQLDGSWERQVSVIAVQDRFLGTTPTPTAVPLRPGG